MHRWIDHTKLESGESEVQQTTSKLITAQHPSGDSV